MTEKLIYKVGGMSCATCARNVETIISSIIGVVKAEVNYASASVLVEFDPGKSGFKDFSEAISPAGYQLFEDIASSVEKDEQRQAKMIHDMFIRVSGAAFFSVPVFILSMFYHHLTNLYWLELILTIPVIFWFGRQFYIIGFNRLLHGSSSMDTLIALGTGAAFIFSFFNTIFQKFLVNHGFEPHVYYESSVIIITFILLGRYLEEKAKQKTSSSIKKLMGLQVKTACLIKGETELEIPVEEIIPGNLLRVKPGEKIPVDGTVVEGSSFIDESMISGESIPVEKIKNDKVIGSTMNQSGSFIMQATRVGSDTLLSQIIRQVKEAQGSKAPIQKLVDRIAEIFVPIVISIALMSFVCWYLLSPNHNLIMAFNALFAVLVIACPCALGLATPTALIAGIGKAAEAGILIKDASSLEKACNLDIIAIDKTGTLTMGKQTVNEIYPALESLDKNLLSVILSMEIQSEHPSAKAVVNFLSKLGLKKINLTHFKNSAGEGIEAIYEEEIYRIGNRQMMLGSGISVSEPFASVSEKLLHEAKMVVYVSQGKNLKFILAISDILKDSAKEAIKILNSHHIEVHLLSGDHENIVSAIALETGIKEYKFNMLPIEKANYIKALQIQGKKIGMAGDGINDSPALAQADVSFAMETGTDIAIESAQIVLLRGDLLKLITSIDFSKKTVQTIRQNLFWAFFYNIIAIPVAAGILYPLWHIQLNPMIAGMAMAFSSVTVVMNSLLLMKKLSVS